ncbi:MAG: hypothetical protein COA84_07650 [Robiginitomaculum sp.]|nr:MAG: hypothetical protein COA84_07650 [Robiginitomaculum sp.]
MGDGADMGFAYGVSGVPEDRKLEVEVLNETVPDDRVKEANKAGFVMLDEFISCGSTEVAILKVNEIAKAVPRVADDGSIEGLVFTNDGEDLRVRNTPSDMTSQILAAARALAVPY